MSEIDIYGPADKAIQIMDRDALRDFGKLKTSKFDEIHLIRAVTTLYRKQSEKAKQRYYEIGFEAYLLGLYLCGISGSKAQKMADKAITKDWVESLMKEIDLVEKYRFNTETDRKAQRLAESLEAVMEAGGSQTGTGTDLEIDRALKAWTGQVGQFAINVTDAAVMEAYQDAEITEGKWVTEKDQRVCSECRALDGKVFKLSEIPVKPHRNCRCRVVPVIRKVSAGKPD